MALTHKEIKQRLTEYREEGEKILSNNLEERQKFNAYIAQEEKIVGNLSLDLGDPENINQINAHFREIEQHIKTLKHQVNQTEKNGQRTHQIEFVNRVNEKQEITNIYCPPYLLITAPKGYGKTRLLETVKTDLEKQGTVFYTNLLSGEFSSIQKITYGMLQQIGEKCVKELNLAESAKPEDCGYEFGKFVIKTLSTTQKNIMILMDIAESIDDNLVKDFLNEFIPAVQEQLAVAGQINLKLILAGRYRADWKQLSVKVTLEPMLLAPFDFSPVFQTVEHFARRKNSFSSLDYRRDFASHLMYFTGGHPGCMAEILNKDFHKPIKKIISNEEEYYQTIVTHVIDEVERHIPSPLREIFVTLSIVRRFDHHLLQWFMDKELFKSPKTSVKLDKLLLQTHLVTKKSGFLQDDITRRLLAIRLRKTEPDRFITICEEAISFYRSRLKDPRCFREDIIAIELLFQTVQYLVYSTQYDADKSLFELRAEEIRHIKKCFFDTLPEILNILVSHRDSQAEVESLIELLEDDMEFRFAFNYLLQEGTRKERHEERHEERHYNEEYPFRDLIGAIEQFKQTLQGENNG